MNVQFYLTLQETGFIFNEDSRKKYLIHFSLVQCNRARLTSLPNCQIWSTNRHV